MPKAAALSVEVDVKNLDEVKAQITALRSMITAKAEEAGLEFNADELVHLEIDWAAMVRKEDTVQIHGDDFIKLSGLRRLARLRGYISSTSRVVQAAEYDNSRNVTVEHTIIWKDGTVDCHAADASWRTINDGFKNFPTAMACNRAEARCIRASLGIEMCSHEEIGPESGDEDLSGPSSDQQKAAINMMLKRNAIDPAVSVEIFGSDLAVKIGETFDLSKITHQEGIALMGALNKFKPKKKK